MRDKIPFDPHIIPSYREKSLQKLFNYHFSVNDAIWYVTDIYGNLLLDYVVLIKRI